MATIVFVLFAIGSNSVGTWRTEYAVFDTEAACIAAKQDMENVNKSQNKFVCWKVIK